MENESEITLTLMIEQTQAGGFLGYLEEIPGIIQVEHQQWKGAYLLLLYQMSAILMEYEHLEKIRFVTKLQFNVATDSGSLTASQN
jgi:hypothetical protein